MKIFVFFIACMASTLGYANVYEYIDDEGLVHLSDSPPDERYVLILRTEAEEMGLEPKIEIKDDSKNSKVKLSFSELTSQIEISARKNQLDSELIHAIIHVESAFQAKAMSHKGAQGLMQLMPQTAKRFGVKNSYDPEQNIEGGAKYLRELLTHFNNDVSLAIAAYNAGENAVVKYGYRIPPYPETQQYVPKVLLIYKALLKQRKMT